ncbi:MAG TPA: flavin reductase family protein [Alphaproteobacteria bacterium]|nr:flavin reductase family protein [Alphaproteobacteria bacterium]
MFYRPQDGHGLPHNPFNAIVAPRPIGWISSLAADGTVNLAPYSFFNAVSYSPPQVIFSGGPGAGKKKDAAPRKDSVANVEATGEFVANIATWELREAMNRSSIESPPDHDEFEYAGLTKAPSELVKPPRVKESPIHLECKYLQSVRLKELPDYHPNIMVVAEVIGIHIDEAVLTDGLIDPRKLKAIARLGYMDYALVDDFFTMRRPRWPEDA